MQGRLVPKYMGRYQAHPKDFWRDEFRIASDFGLDSIEFILDYNDADENPLLTQDGIYEIKAVLRYLLSRPQSLYPRFTIFKYLSVGNLNTDFLTIV